MHERQRQEEPASGPLAHTVTAPETHPLYVLQGQAGNQAVHRFVQRQVLDPVAPASADPLDDAQVGAALSFYRRQPWLYTAAVITDLRTRLGLDPAGGIAADLAQAVARFQRDEGANDPSLVIDGMAGPRSTPRLFPAGLARAGEGATFGGEAQTVFDQWDTLASAQARADALVAAVNRRLASAGVTTVTVGLYDGDSPTEKGSFDFATWTMMLNRLLLGQSGLTQQDAADLADTVYHEARHTEQWFTMARYLAGQGYSAPGIARQMGIPANVARDAKDADPVRPGTTDAVIASGWYESVYGSGSAHREAVLTRVEEADWAVATAECRCRRAPSPANDLLLERARAEFDVAHEAYRELPEENDAWATGPMAVPAVTRGTPNPIPTPGEDPCERLRRAGRPVPAATGGSGP